MEEGRRAVSSRQLAILLFCGLLSPMTQVMPSLTAHLAGAGGWLGGVLALPVFLLALWLTGGTARRLPAGTGLGGLYRLAFGPVLGRAASLVTMLWLLLAAAVQLRFCAEGFLSSIYPGTGVWLFLLSLTAVVWWVSAHGAAAVCRMGQMFLYILCVTAGVVLLFALPGVRLYHIWPVWLEGWDSLLASALPVLSVLGYALPVLLTQERPSGRGGTAGWFIALGLLGSLMGLVIIGTFGWQMAARFQLPLFSLAKEVTLLDLVERLETVVAALWVFSDIAMLCALLLALQEQGAALTRRMSRTLMRAMLCVLMTIIAAFLAPGGLALQGLWRRAILPGNLAVCYLLPLAACLAARMRKMA